MIRNPNRRDDIVLISYYTDLLYGRHAAKLADSAEKFGIEHDIQPVPDRGSWRENNLFKPAFIRLAMEAHPGKAVMWVDADALILQDPVECFTDDFDVAAYFWEPGKPWGGTLVFRPTEAAMIALGSWVDFCATYQPLMDQDTLGLALYKRVGFRFKHLPAAYCWVEKIHRLHHGITQPVIEHYMVGH